MRAHWWSCVLGLLCLPAEVTLNTWTASQNPSTISVVRVNSSVEITCSTTVPDPIGLYLERRFPNIGNIMFLSLREGQITKNTITDEFNGRIQVTQKEDTSGGHEFTMSLSLRGPEDTNLYFCRWIYFESKRGEVSSNGTVIIVTEKDPQEHCSFHFLDLTFITLSVTAFTIISCVAIGAMILRCKRFKKDFQPMRVEITPRPYRPVHVCAEQRTLHSPYLVTSHSTLDFRGIL
ncbi:uncharacterized protein LOC128381577 [Scomber japonicus]|uniref:uncharacterized protein LOC128381577 n=1 Tax=Scomber japonicus TaxID=13676 RepID=UPI002305E93C|nr:uncharacterized protein LOC128381577 [Scomber japonicus]